MATGTNQFGTPGSVTINPTPPGATIQTFPDTVVPAVAGVAVALPIPTAGVTRVRYMNTVQGSVVRIRELPGAVGSGMLMFYGGQQEYGAPGGSIATMEVEWISGPNSAVAMQEEGP